MSAERKFHTLEEILKEFPPKEEVFPQEGKEDIQANVSRNEAGDIVYVEPFSTRHISPEAPLQEVPEEPQDEV